MHHTYLLVSWEMVCHFPVSTARSESYTTTDLMSCSRTHQQGKLLTQRLGPKLLQLVDRLPAPFCCCAEALMPCSMKVTEERLLNEKASDLWSTGAVFCLDLCVLKGGFRSAACYAASVDNCHYDILKHFDSCTHPPLERLIKIKLVSCAP